MDDTPFEAVHPTSGEVAIGMMFSLLSIGATAWWVAGHEGFCSQGVAAAVGSPC